MTKKSFFDRIQKRPKQQPKPVDATPRSSEAIQADYKQSCAAAGEVQYRIEAEKARLAQINNHINDLNNEANARAKLDTEVKDATPEKSA